MKRTVPLSSPPLRHRAGRLLAALRSRLREKAVKALQKLEARMSLGQKKVALILLCALAGGYCSYLLLRAAGAGPPAAATFILPPNHDMPGLPMPPVSDSTQHYLKTTKK
ncbi:hypothetical protein [Pedobacter suwonensis]|nr:hypothetical protein [Pedobacter suwonensis]